MATFAVEYRYGDDAAARDERRLEHRAWLGAQEWVLLSGPLADPAGALVIVAASSREQAEERMSGDPFWRDGVVAERTVRAYDPVLGSASAAFAPHRDQEWRP